MQNPLHLDENGEYTLILPAGEYYLRATAPGAVPVNSEIFRIDTPTAIIQSFRLRAYQTVWDLWQSEAVPVVITQLRQSSVSKQKWGFPFPAFQLEKQGRTFTELDLRGATTLVTVLNAWSPSTQHQLPYLRSLAEDGQVRVVVVFPHERESTLELLSSQLGNKIVAIADTDGTLSSRLGVVTAPMHLILNHQAIIQNIVYGVHSPDELRSYLIH